MSLHVGFARVGCCAVAQELVGRLITAGARVTFGASATEALWCEAPTADLVRLGTSARIVPGAGALRDVAAVARAARTTLALLRTRARNRKFIVIVPNPLIVSVPVLAPLLLTGARQSR